MMIGTIGELFLAATGGAAGVYEGVGAEGAYACCCCGVDEGALEAKPPVAPAFGLVAIVAIGGAECCCCGGG
jgi:hypothetical protein